MSDWFCRLGRPLGAEERDQVGDYLTGLGLGSDFQVESVPDWAAAHATIADPRWDQRWWDAEQREKDRLARTATETLGEHEFWSSLSTSLASADRVYQAAAVEAGRDGYADAALIRAAAGALSHALYLAELSRVAGAGERHPFSIKKALFAAGRWPLGIVHQTYYVF